MMHESQWLLVAAAVKCISMIGKRAIIPNVEVEILVPVAGDKIDDDDDIEYESRLRDSLLAAIFLLLILLYIFAFNSRESLNEAFNLS